MTRKERKAMTRDLVVKAARDLFAAHPYDRIGIRDVANEIGMSMGAVTANFDDKAALYRAAMGFPAPWRPISMARKDGTLMILLVDYDELTNRADVEAEEAAGYVWSPNPLEDERFARTIGSNEMINTGEDRWTFAGWNWSQDHYTQGRGTPVAFIVLGDVAPEVVAGA